jgi:2'-5' RNA ligase
MPKKYAHINFTPPNDVQAAARRGLALRRKFGRGGLSRKEASAQGIGSGVQRATNLANGDKVSPKTIGRMVSFFARHEKNKDSKTPGGEPGAGQISWLLWGGTPGQRWATKVKRQMEAADMKNKSLATLAQQVLIVRGKMENEAQNGDFDAPDGPIVERIEVRPFPEIKAAIEAALVEKINARPLPLTYKSGGHTGAMIALFLPTSIGGKFALGGPSALPPSEMHVTLAYLGKVDQLTEWQKEHAHEAIKLIAENHPPLQGNINGCGRFCNDDDEGDPFFVIPDLPKLPNLRQIVVDFIDSRCEIEPANNHGYTPHITLAYILHSNPNPFDSVELTPVTFPTISLVLGDNRYDYPFTMGLSNISKAALIQKIGARHTSAECTTIQKMHDLTLDLGAECHPLTRRAGAKHSIADQAMIQRIHDDCSGLGAVCKAMPERDRVYSSQVLKDGEVIKGSAGSGNYGHDGRPGRRGGSQSGGGLRRIGAKKDSKPGARKRAARKFREKRREKTTKKTKGLSKSDKSFLLSLDERGQFFGITTEAAIRPDAFTGLKKKDIKDASQMKKLKDSGFLKETKISSTNSEYKLTNEGRKAIGLGISSKEVIDKMPSNLDQVTSKQKDGFIDELSKLSSIELNRAINENFQKMTSVKDDVSINNSLVLSEWLDEAVEKALKRVNKASITIKAQSDAPNYAPASTPQRCANCRFFLGDPGRDWCERFDFTADQDYHCDDWEAQRPDEIPGYVANKGDLAALTEGILILRGGQN